MAGVRKGRGREFKILPSRSPFNARHAGYSVKDFYPLQRAKFPPVGFIQSRTVLPMHRQSNPITPHETFLNCFDPSSIKLCIFFGLYFDFVLSPVFRYKALVGVLSSSMSTLPRPDFPGSHGAKKHYRLVLFWARALQSFYFLCLLSWRMQTLQWFLRTSTPLTKSQARNVWRLNSEISQDGTFFHYPFFCIKHSFIYFLLSDGTPRDETRDRDVNSSGQNWRLRWDLFFAPALSLAFAEENVKIYCSRFALVKKFELNF